MADLILAPICPNCHYIFENFSITIETEPIDENNRFCYKQICYSNTYCPQCKEPITGIKGQRFPPKNDCFEFDLKDI